MVAFTWIYGFKIVLELSIRFFLPIVATLFFTFIVIFVLFSVIFFTLAL